MHSSKTNMSFFQKTTLFVVCLSILYYFIYTFSSIFLPFFTAFILAYLINPIIDRLEFVFKKRIFAILFFYIFFGVLLFILLKNVMPLIISELNDLTANLPYYFTTIKTWVISLKTSYELELPILKQLDIFKTIQSKMEIIFLEIVNYLPQFFISTFSTISYLLLIPIVLFFFLLNDLKIKSSFYKVIPNKYFEVSIHLLYSIGKKLGNYLRGILFETLIISTFSIFILFFIGADYSIILGLVAGVMNIIPYVGPLLGAIPAIIVLYLKFKSLNILLYLVIGFGIVQLIDNMILKPIIYSQSVDMDPVFVMFTLLLGGSVGGIWGLIVAIPIGGILKVIISIISKEISFRLTNKELPT
jgi:predicted PurR-regulated permease PerM